MRSKPTRDEMLTFAGYRPCKRCRPLELPGQRPAWVSRLIARVEVSPEAHLKASDLRAIGIDPGRARRWFLAHFGMTFTRTFGTTPGTGNRADSMRPHARWPGAATRYSARRNATRSFFS